MAKGADSGIPTAVMTFDPQPREYFGKDATSPARLTRFREKISLLKTQGVSDVICLPFNEVLASMSAHDFVKTLLVDGLNVQHLIVGDDFRFGRGREGDFALLKSLGEQYGFEVVQTPVLDFGKERVSSSRIREALEKSDFALAESLLGRVYSMEGRVAHGDKRGRTIGFPTANIFLHRDVSPVRGVYAIKMHGIEAEPVTGVANVGTRPTVEGTRSLLEVHLFNFNREIYGAHVRVEFFHKLRDEKKFESFDMLKQQIDRDAQAARDYFNN